VNPYARHRRGTITTQGIAAFWLGFYMLAALRSLIPGACETQACVLDRAEARAKAEACCASTSHDGQPVWTAPTEAHEPHCAMCSLMTAAANPVAVMVSHLEPAPSETQPIRYSLAAQRPQHDPAAPRAPPALASIAV
jgi:hypothetical protein